MKLILTLEETQTIIARYLQNKGFSVNFGHIQVEMQQVEGRVEVTGFSVELEQLVRKEPKNANLVQG